MGEKGAIQYLADYGRGIAAPKVVTLALCAESEGYPEMAQGFWKKAFELSTGEKPSPREPHRVTNTIPNPTSSKSKKFLDTNIPELPPHLQPGRIVTMQPVDAPNDRSYYIDSPDYWGQPKRDGNRLVVIAMRDHIYYQSRSTRLRSSPSIEINQRLLDAVAKLGTFILDGELYYRSITGSEHRTGSQAATVNIARGAATTQPQPVYAIFKALMNSCQDLTIATEAERLEAAQSIGKYLAYPEFEVVPTARTKEEKTTLVQRQQSEEREGEIWVLHSCTYVGGKDSRKYPMVRTKYSIELDLVITGLTPTTAAHRPFGSIMVAQDIVGGLVPMGLVGTGFSHEDMREIARRHTANPGGVKITVRSQGLTESGSLWHGRFIGFCE